MEMEVYDQESLQGTTAIVPAELPFSNFYTPENSRFYAAQVYKPLDSKTEAFRVLEVLQGTGDDIIRCNIIEPFHLESSYEALSYRAGDPHKTGQVLVNGHQFNVFATLFAAIKRLRHPDKSRLLWADQICINQSDVFERNNQVQKMRSVYEKAERVIAWLGPLCGGELAFNAAHSFYQDYVQRRAQYKSTLMMSRELQTSEHDDIVQIIASEYLEELRLADQTEDNEYLIKAKSLGQFYHYDFWNRVWIWQEIVVAKTVELLWDTRSMDSQPFFITARILMAMGIDLLSSQLPQAIRYILLPSVNRPTIHLISVVDDLRHSWNPKSHLNIKYLLRKIRRAQSSDLRDRIYAVSGLIPPDYRIIPDYFNDPASVYCRTAWSIILRDRSLDILAFCGYPAHRSQLALPTWCPDWSVGSRASREPLTLEATDARRQGIRESRFQPSKKLPAYCCMEVEKDKNAGTQTFTLSVQGLLIDTVEEVAPRYRKGHFGSLPSRERYQVVLGSCCELVSKRKTITDIIEREVDRTLTVDNCGASNESDPNYSPRRKDRLKVDVVAGSRQFFLGKTGIMGMGPPHVLAGDLICVLFGSRVPFLLRKDGKFYTLVGEVYISGGHMEGKAIEEMDAGLRSAKSFELR
jgi:hypothetical protein